MVHKPEKSLHQARIIKKSKWDHVDEDYKKKSNYQNDNQNTIENHSLHQNLSWAIHHHKNHHIIKMERKAASNPDKMVEKLVTLVDKLNSREDILEKELGQFKNKVMTELEKGPTGMEKTDFVVMKTKSKVHGKNKKVHGDSIYHVKDTDYRSDGLDESEESDELDESDDYDDDDSDASDINSAIDSDAYFDAYFDGEKRKVTR